DPVLEQIQLRPRLRPRIPRRLSGRQRPPDRLAMQPRPPTDLPDRELLAPRQPPDLRPLLHVDHTAFLLADRHRSDEGPDPAGQHRPHARWVTFQPAQVEQYSTGAHRMHPTRHSMAWGRQTGWSRPCGFAPSGGHNSYFPRGSESSRFSPKKVATGLSLKLPIGR